MRYFIFFYYFIDSGVIAGHGYLSILSPCFPACSDVIKIASRRQNLKVSEIVLTGWQEMTEEDYVNFTKE